LAQGADRSADRCGRSQEIRGFTGARRHLAGTSF